MASLMSYLAGSKCSGATKPSSTSNAKHKYNGKFPPGTQIRRPIETASQKHQTAEPKICLAYHYAIVIYSNLIMEFTDSNTHSIVYINLNKTTFTAVKYPRDKQHSISIIQRALSKYNVEQKYDIMNYNCEHFANFCYYGYKSSDQFERIFFIGFGSSIGSILGLEVAHIVRSINAFCYTKLNVFEIQKLVEKNACDCCWRDWFLSHNGEWIAPLSDTNIGKSFTLYSIWRQVGVFRTNDLFDACFLPKTNGNYKKYMMIAGGTLGVTFGSLYLLGYIEAKLSKSSESILDDYNMNDEVIVDIKVALKLYDRTKDRDELIKEILDIIFHLKS